jgi:hypothetical protein
MGKFLIEVKHGGDKNSCLLAIQSFLASRSHYVSSVEWGCLEGERKAWLIIKAENKETALRILPAAYRQNAKITEIHKLTLKEIDQAVINQHSKEQLNSREMAVD